MGVRACNRDGCDSISCDRCSLQHGYICWECFEELIKSGPKTRIIDFMKSLKQESNEKAAIARFNVAFPIF